jgi:hypothetical protein
MTVPTSNVKFSDIWTEAGNSGPSSTISMLSMSFFSYFAGPNGANSVGYNAWGQGEGSGVNRIYGTSAKTTGLQVGDFDGLTYYYDNSTFACTLSAQNSLPPPGGFPPPPPDQNDVNVNVELWDSSFSYQYLMGGGMANSGGGMYGPATVSQTTDPIIFRGYWKVTVTGANPSFAGGTCNISINGTSKVSGGSIPGGPGGATFDSSTYGTEDVASYGGFTGLYFDVTVN